MKSPESQSSTTAIIIALIGLIGTCLIAIATLTTPIVGVVAQKYFNSEASFQTPNSITAPNFPTLSSADATLPNLSDVVPSGGSGDDIQRTSAWSYVIIAAAIDECGYNLQASTTTIKVTQETDAQGVWIEEWTVVCNSGSKKTYTLTFTPMSNGDTDIQVK